MRLLACGLAVVKNVQVIKIRRKHLLSANFYRRKFYAFVG